MVISENSLCAFNYASAAAAGIDFGDWSFNFCDTRVSFNQADVIEI